MPQKKSSPLQKTLNVWALVLIVWSFYRAKVQLPPVFDEFVAKPLIFVVPVYYYITRFEQKPFLKAIDFTNRRLGREIAVGFLIGIPIFASSFLAFYLKNGTFSGVFSQGFQIGAVLLFFMMAIMTAFSQEVLSRGFVLKRLYGEWHNMYSAAFVASLLFFLLHIPALFANNALEGSTLLLLLSTTLSLSFINSFVYLSERSLVPCILIHALYSTSIFIFF